MRASRRLQASISPECSAAVRAATSWMLRISTRVEVAAARLPVVAAVLGDEAHAGLEAFQRVGAGADRLRPVGEVLRHDDEVVVGQDDREVGIAARQRDPDLGRRQRLDLGDLRQNALGRRLGLAAVHVDRIDAVVGVERLAVGELDALADVEHPLVAPGFTSQLSNSSPVGLPSASNSIRQLQISSRRDHDGVRHRCAGRGCRGRAAFHAQAQRAALLRRRLRQGRSRAEPEAEAEAERGGARHQLAPVEDQAALSRRVFRHVISPLDGPLVYTPSRYPDVRSWP